MAYFHCLIGGGSSGGGYELTVTCDADFAGKTITCTDGVTTLTQTCTSSSPYNVVFEIPNGGEWTISGIISGQTYSTAIDIPDSLELHSVPDGSTVTPTDDIQTWLACAGITDKAYTTLNEVLADSTTLLALMSDNNAVDYLVRSKNFAGVTGGLVPTMTSNTTPSGVCSANSVYSSSYDAYKAFDNNTTDESCWVANSASNEWIQYEFLSAICVNKIELTNRYGGASNQGVNTFDILASNDNFASDSHVLYSGTATQTSSKEVQSFSFSNNSAYKYYRLLAKTNHGNPSIVAVLELQFYQTGITQDSTAMTDIGANNYCANTLLSDSTWAAAIGNSSYIDSVLNTKVPTMTSDTTPSGTCFDSSHVSNFEAYKAFDNVSTAMGGTAWLAAANATHSYCGYDFGENVNVSCMSITYGHNQQANKNINVAIQYSDDNQTWNTAKTVELFVETTLKTTKVSFPLVNGRYFRIYDPDGVAWYSGSLTFEFFVNEIQFYGRVDI